MNKQLLRIVRLAIATIVLLGPLAACNKESTQSPDTSTVNQAGGATPQTPTSTGTGNQ